MKRISSIREFHWIHRITQAGIESRRKDKEGQEQAKKGREYIRQGKDISCLKLPYMDSTEGEEFSTIGNADREGILRVFWAENGFHNFHRYNEGCNTILNRLTIEKRENNSISLSKCIIIRIFFI